MDGSGSTTGTSENAEVNKKNQGCTAYEKRATRRAIRELHQAVQANNVQQVQQLITPTIDVDFHYNRQTALQIAVLNNNERMCQLLINHGANVDEYNAEDNTLLNMAAWHGNYDAASVLVKHGADLDVRNHRGSTPLNTVIYKGHYDIAKLLIDADCDIDKCDKRGLSPLLTCAMFGRTEIAPYLIKANCDINYADFEKRTAVMHAAKNSFPEMVELLTNNGCDLTLREQFGCTAIFIAAEYGQTECVRLLIKAKSPVSTTDTKGRSPLHVAIRGHHIEIASLLVAAKCEVNQQEKDSLIAPLHAAVRLASQWVNPSETGKLEGGMIVVKLLLDAGCNPDLQDKSGWTALHHSTFGGHIDVTRLLLEKKANVDIVAQLGDVPLHGAMFSNKPPIINMLLDAECNVNIANKRNEIPLYNAIDLRSSIETVRRLTEKGSDLNIKENEEGRSLLHAAIKKKYSEAAKLLISSGCDVNLFDKSGTTPLGLACGTGEVEVVKALLEHPDCELDTGNKNIPIIAAARSGNVRILKMLYEAGVDLDKMTDMCETAFQQAADRNHTEVVRLLVSWGSNPSAPAKITTLRRCCLSYEDNHPHLELDPLYAAVKNDNFKMIRLIILGTPRTNYRSIRDLDDLIFRTGFASQARLNRVTLYQYAEFFRRMQSQPRRLLDECRGVIRECLGQRLENKVDKLDLPGRLQDFLLLKQELEKFA